MVDTLAYRALILEFALLGTVALAACGGGTGYKPSNPASATIASSSTAANTTATAAATPPTSAGLKDPCGYVTVAELGSATGKTVSGDPVHVNDFVCRYLTTDGVINVGVASPVDKARFEQQTQANYGTGTPATLPGLGDDAFAVYGGVAVHQGSNSISVQISPSPEATGGTAAIALAKLLLQKI